MKAWLAEKLHQYIAEQNPEVLLKLQEGMKVTTYINDRVLQIIPRVRQWLSEGMMISEAEERAVKEMTADLRPSRFLYLKNILEEDFPKEAEAFRESGVLTYELVNLIGHCDETFRDFQFCEENQHNRKLRYAIIADIADYLN